MIVRYETFKMKKNTSTKSFLSTKRDITKHIYRDGTCPMPSIPYIPFSLSFSIGTFLLSPPPSSHCRYARLPRIWLNKQMKYPVDSKREHIGMVV